MTQSPVSVQTIVAVDIHIKFSITVDSTSQMKLGEISNLLNNGLKHRRYLRRSFRSKSNSYRIDSMLKKNVTEKRPRKLRLPSNCY